MSEEGWDAKAPFNGKVYSTPGGASTKSFLDVLKWQWTRESAPWPEQVENVARPSLPTTLGPSSMAVTFINHATVLLQFPGLNVLTDPVFAERVSPVSFAGPRRVRTPGLALVDLPRVDLVLVSHNHYDHMDEESLKEIHRRHGPRFLVPKGERARLEDWGIERVEEFDWWENVSLPAPLDARVTFAPAAHWSGRGLFDRYATLWGSFYIEKGPWKVYFAGDTGYAAHFRVVRRKLGAPDFALLPIGAYEPRWFMREQHMNPSDAVLAHADLGARRSMGIHFGTFQLTDEALNDPRLHLESARTDAGLTEEDFRAFNEGETRMFEHPGDAKE
jgi:L-ascorbate metabolism protein UlaG (beta-lactamase superfamily)